MAENAIIEQLESARAELAHVEEQIAKWSRQRDILRAKVEAFSMSAKYIAEIQAAKPSPRSATRKRATSVDWTRIFQEMYERYNAGFGYDELLAVASTLGIDVKRDSLRTKMMTLANQGTAERINDGQFRITSAGVGKLGLEIKKPDAEASGSKRAVTGRGAGFPSDDPSGSIPDASTDTSRWRPSSEVDLDDEIPF